MKKINFLRYFLTSYLSLYEYFFIGNKLYFLKQSSSHNSMVKDLQGLY